MNNEAILVKANHHTSKKIICNIADQLLQVRVPVVFFYRHSVDPIELIESLKVVLIDFPLFAGTLKQQDGDLIIDCNNNGVSFLASQSDSSLESLIDNLPNSDNQELVLLIDAATVISMQSPIFTIKVTYCSCGGMAMGFCWHHSIGDMYSLIQFLKAWSATISKKDYILPLIVDDRKDYIQKRLSKNNTSESAVRYLHLLDILKLTYFVIFKAKDKSSFRIYFTEDELENIRQDYSNKIGMGLSKNDSLCAFLFKTISELDKKLVERTISIAINYRNSLGLDKHILGNFISMINITKEDNIQPHELAKFIREAILEFKSDHMNYLSTEHYVNRYGGVRKAKRFLNKSFDPLNRSLMVTNWNKLGIYDVYFGGDKPYFFAFYGIIPIPWLSCITEGFNGDGLIYSAVLPKNIANNLLTNENLKVIHKFRSDHDIVPEIVSKRSWIY